MLKLKDTPKTRSYLLSLKYKKNMRILIVEDDKEVLEILKHRLEEEQFAVDTAINGENGSFMARTNDYDLIILDFVLPKKDGLNICKDIREKSGKTTPIIITSVKAETSSKINMFNAGVDDYITKPYAFEELLARMKALLRRPKQIEEEILAIDDLVLDTRKQTVHRKEQEIYLTRKEFMLLKYFMKNYGSVLSRCVLMEHVWDTRLDPFSNTLETHIKNLRKKIHLPRTRKLIHTISGRGYKMN